MTEQIDLNDYVALQARATAFFSNLMAVVKHKDDKIKILKEQLAAAQATLIELSQVRSDFALLKDKTVASAKEMAENIQKTLEAE